MKHLSKILLIGIICAFAAQAAAQELPERIKKAGKIIVATKPNYPPITYKDPATNQLMGLDIDLGEAIAKELGVAIEWQDTEFAQIFSSLQTGRVDMALQGISDLPTRREVADFVNYLRTGSQFYTSPANAATIKSQEDLCGKTVGASRSTNWPVKIEEWSAANCVAKGKAAIKVVGTEGSADARTQLKSGRLDAAVQGQETLPYSQKLEPNQYVLIGQPFTEDLMGIPFTKTDTQLRDAVKAAIERLQAKGVYDQILAKYGLQANKYTPITINQGK